MKKFLTIFLTFLFVLFSVNLNEINTLFASPENAIHQEDLAEKLLIKLQNSVNFDEELEKQYKYLDILCRENTQFYSYNIKEIEILMDKYRENVVAFARDLAKQEEYKKAVEFLETKSELFKDKSSINSLITYYSKFFIKDGLFYCQEKPKIVCVNKLIAYPNLAFQNNNNCEDYEKFYLTNKEFLNLLNEFYTNDYILIDLYDYINVSNEVPIIQDLYLPQNKKPLILLFNNINYFEDESCFIDKFILDSNNKIATYSIKQPQNLQISYSADFIPILDNFIEENKNFSYNNAKGIISFNSLGNILGYNISKTNPNLNNDINNLKNIVLKLKETGYKFAFSNNNTSNSNTDDEIKYINDTLLNIFTNLNIFVSINKNCVNPFYTRLNGLGFKIFIDNSNNTISIKNNLAFLGYFEINGNILRQKKDYFGLNFEKIYDHNNRSKIY